MFLFLVGSSVIFSFGYEFREMVVFNVSLVVNSCVLFVITAVALLIDHNSFTDLWHVASYPFNGENTESPTWMEYQANGNPPSPGMPFSLRLEIFLIICGLLVGAAVWQGVVLEGPVGDWIRRQYPSQKRAPYVC
jgi:hypothetical protein